MSLLKSYISSINPLIPSCKRKQLLTKAYQTKLQLKKKKKKRNQKIVENCKWLITIIKNYLQKGTKRENIRGTLLSTHWSFLGYKIIWSLNAYLNLVITLLKIINPEIMFFVFWNLKSYNQLVQHSYAESTQRCWAEMITSLGLNNYSVQLCSGNRQSNSFSPLG